MDACVVLGDDSFRIGEQKSEVTTATLAREPKPDLSTHRCGFDAGVGTPGPPSRLDTRNPTLT
jgi:hypothetical protein